MVHPETGDLLEEAQHLLPFAPSVDHHRHGTDVHAVGRKEQQVAAHAVQFAEEHAHPHSTFRDVAVDAEQLLGGHREHQLVVERTDVVHAGDVGAALHEGEVLAGLLHAGVEIADDRLAAQHFLATQFQHQAQHTVGARMLRTHVDDHRLILCGIDGNATELGRLGLAHSQHRTDFAQQLAGGQLAARLQSLLSVVAGLDRVDDAHVRAAKSVENCTGIVPVS